MSNTKLYRPYSIIPSFKGNENVRLNWFCYFRTDHILPYSELITEFKETCLELGYDEKTALERVLKWDFQPNSPEEPKRMEELLYSIAYADELFKSEEVIQIIKLTNWLGLNLLIEEYDVPLSRGNKLPYNFTPMERNYDGVVYYDKYYKGLSVPVAGYYCLFPGGTSVQVIDGCMTFSLNGDCNCYDDEYGCRYRDHYDW